MLHNMETFRHVGGMPCLRCAVHTTQPVHVHHSIRSISFHQAQPINTTRLTLHRPAPNTHKHKSPVRRLIAASLDMFCPDFVSLMCIHASTYTHASTQKVQALLDKGAHPNKCDPRYVRVCAFKGSVSVHIRLVCIAALFTLASGCVVCRAGAQCAGRGVTSPTPMHP